MAVIGEKEPGAQLKAARYPTPTFAATRGT